MIVRPAEPRDEDAVVEITGIDIAETLPHLGFDPEITRQTFREALKPQNPFIFVAEKDGLVVGFLMAFVNPYAFTTGFFSSQEVIYVRPEYRGTRAAALLLEAFNSWSDRIGAREVFVGVANGRKAHKFAAFVQRMFSFDFAGLYLRRIRHEQGR